MKYQNIESMYFVWSGDGEELLYGVQTYRVGKKMKSCIDNLVKLEKKK